MLYADCRLHLNNFSAGGFAFSIYFERGLLYVIVKLINTFYWNFVEYINTS